MGLKSKLNAWVAAGLIDAEAAARIEAFEAAEERPVVLWSVIGLGLLALVLGIMLIIASNWAAIPAAVKISVHLALVAAAAYGVWRGITKNNAWLTDGSLFVMGALVLSGIALHAQIYQLTGPLWQALLFWLALMTPAVLVCGATRLSAYGWSLMTLWTLGAIAFDVPDKGIGIFMQGLALSGPALLVLVGLLPVFGRSDKFRLGQREIGIIALLAAASTAHFAWADGVSLSEAEEWLQRLIWPVLAAAIAWAAGWWSQLVPRGLLTPLLITSTLAGVAAFGIPHADAMTSRLLGAIIFVGMWGWIAYAANREGWRGVFGIAIAAIAIRIFIIYFELFGSLAMTGTGLMTAGLLLIALTLGWRRVVRARSVNAASANSGTDQ